MDSLCMACLDGRRAHSSLTNRWIAGIVFAVLLVGRVRGSDEDFAKRLSAGTEEASAGDLSSAMADLEAAVALDPANASGWYELGVIYGQMGDFRRAEAMFRDSLQFKPDVAITHYRLGLTLIANPQSKLDWPGAIAEFREALRLQPDYPEALNYLGAGLIAVGDTAAAIPVLEHAVQAAASGPMAALAHFNLAVALEKSARLDEAAREYAAAVAAKGNYPEASSALGKLFLRTGRMADAERELRVALVQNPDLTDAHYALARVLQAEKSSQPEKSSEAAAEFDQASALSQREQDAIESSRLSNLALEMAAKGDLPGAANSLRKAITLKPDYGVPHLNLGLILADSGDMTGAAAELTKAISLLPGQARPWYDLARVQRRQGNLDGALKSLTWAARLAPADSAIRSELSSLRTAAGAGVSNPAQPPAAGASSDTPAGHFAFGTELAQGGDWLGAIGEFRRSLALNPSQQVVRLQLALSYRQQGDLEAAVREYRKLLLADPGDIENRLAVGRCLLDEGHKQEAAAEFKAVLRLRPDSIEARKGLDQATGGGGTR